VRKNKHLQENANHIVRYGDNLGGVFMLATGASYPAFAAIVSVKPKPSIPKAL
jgi:hypothetical protein